MKKGILVVSFGTTHKDTREKTIVAIEKRIAKEYKDYRIYRAFTSDMVRNTIEKKEGISIPDVKRAMKQMIADGITELIIQPTHVISGIENDKMILQASQYKEKFLELKIGDPLLEREEDFRQVAEALLVKLEEKGLLQKQKQAVILMGHGSEHEANSSYTKLQDTFLEKGYQNIFVSTVEGEPDIYETMERMQEQSFSSVLLVPFMIVAGEHAKNDMAGDEEDSWKSILTKRGYNVTCMLKGLGEYEKIRSILIEHVRRE